VDFYKNSLGPNSRRLGKDGLCPWKGRYEVRPAAKKCIMSVRNASDIALHTERNSAAGKKPKGKISRTCQGKRREVSLVALSRSRISGPCAGQFPRIHLKVERRENQRFSRGEKNFGKRSVD